MKTDNCGHSQIIAIVNTIMYGIKVPNIVETNAQSDHLAGIQKKDHCGVVRGNPGQPLTLGIRP